MNQQSSNVIDEFDLAMKVFQGILRDEFAIHNSKVAIEQSAIAADQSGNTKSSLNTQRLSHLLELLWSLDFFNMRSDTSTQDLSLRFFGQRDLIGFTMSCLGRLKITIGIHGYELLVKNHLAQMTYQLQKTADREPLAPQAFQDELNRGENFNVKLLGNNEWLVGIMLMRLNLTTLLEMVAAQAIANTDGVARRPPAPRH